MVAAVAALTALAAILRFTRLGHQGFWFDEGNTALLVRQPAGEMLRLLRHSESTPPLYYCLAWIWVRVFGRDEYGLRSLSALAGTLTVPAIHLAGSRLVSRRTGVAAAALVATNPLLIWYSQEARAYSMLILLSAATLAALGGALATPGRRPLTIWGVLAAVALATHYYAVLVVVPQALLLLWRRRRTAVPAVAGVAVVGLALLPLAVLQERTNLTSWIHAIPLNARLTQLLPTFLLGFQGPAYDTLVRVVAVTAALGVVALAAWAPSRAPRGAVRCARLLAAGVALELVLVAAGADDLLTRNLLALWVPGAVVVAAGLAELPTRRWVVRLAGSAAVVAVCAAGTATAIGVAVERRWQRPDWRVVARLIGPRSAPGIGPRAVLVQHLSVLLPLSLYVDDLHFWPGARAGAVGGGRTVRVRELDVISFTAPRASLCWYGAACNLTGSRAQRRYAVPGLRQVWRRHVLQFTVVRLESPRPVAINLTIVARALRTTHARSDELLLAH